MRILIVTPHFYPESFKCNDMAFDLAQRGHAVHVMTAIPDYPKGRFFEGYGVFKRRQEIIQNVKVYRSLIIPRGNGSPIRLAVNYISYTFFAVFQALRLGIAQKYDAILVHQLSPVMVGIPAVIVKKIQKIPIYFWVLDLWPESLSAAGGIENKWVLGLFGKLTKWLYRNSEKILVSSKGFRTSICRKGDFDNKIVFFPNWVDEAINTKLPVRNAGFPRLPDGFIVMFAGNMGDAQDLPAVMEAARLLKDKLDLHFVFVGDGRKRDWVEDFIIKYGLEQTVCCAGRFPLESMPLFFEKADVLFLSLKDTEIFKLTVPARLQAYMSAGKPIVAMLNGEGAQVIAEADCGYSVGAGDSHGLAALLAELSKTDKTILQEKGRNGQEYSKRHYCFEKCMDNLNAIMEPSKKSIKNASKR